MVFWSIIALAVLSAINVYLAALGNHPFNAACACVNILMTIASLVWTRDR